MLHKKNMSKQLLNLLNKNNINHSLNETSILDLLISRNIEDIGIFFNSSGFFEFDDDEYYSETRNEYDLDALLKFRISLCWISLFIALLGLVGNFISFLILIDKKMRISTNVFLASLCVSSFIALLGLLVNSVVYELINYYKLNAIHFLYHIYPYAYPVINTFQMASILLTVCVSVNQFICIYYSKLKVRSKKSTDDECKTALIVVVIMYIISIIYCIPYWLKFKYNKEQSLHVTTIGQDPLFNKVVHLWMYLPIVYIIPFTILILTNSYLLTTIMVARKRRLRLDRDSWNTERCASSKVNENKKLVNKINDININNNLLSNALENEEQKQEIIELNSDVELEGDKTAFESNANKNFKLDSKRSNREAIQNDSSLIKENGKYVKRSGRRAGGMNITIMLIAVVFLFFICQFPNLILHIIQSIYCSTEKTRCINSGLYQYCYVIIKFLLIINLSFNFACYCLFSEKFREVLKEKFISNKKENPKANNNNIVPK